MRKWRGSEGAWACTRPSEREALLPIEKRFARTPWRRPPLLLHTQTPPARAWIFRSLDPGGRTHTSSHPPLNQPSPYLQLAEGRVIAAGPGRRSALSGDLVPPSVKEGDTVLLPEYGGQVLKLDSKE